MGLTTAKAAINIDGNAVNEGIVGSQNTADVVIQNWVVTITTFLFIIAVIVILYAGFQILTAA
jgi:hypothetical protein